MDCSTNLAYVGQFPCLTDRQRFPYPSQDYHRVPLVEELASSRNIQPLSLSYTQGGHFPNLVVQPYDNRLLQHRSLKHGPVTWLVDPNPSTAAPQSDQFSDGDNNTSIQPIPSPPKQRNKKAQTLCNDKWEAVKPRLIELHVAKSLPLPKVKEMIEEEFKSIGFTATIRQYRSRLSLWGRDKNVKSNEMKAIVRKKQHRKLVETNKGKLAFRVRGYEVKPHKINRWMKRNCITQTAICAVSPAASTPSDVSCWTISGRGSPDLTLAGSVASPTSIANQTSLYSNGIDTSSDWSKRRTYAYPGNSVTFPQATPYSSSSETALGLSASSIPKSQRLLELELMHRWSTTTYKSICTLPEDEPCFQVELPCWALKHEFLLHGIFAMSALEAAICATPKMHEAKSAMYIHIALDYYNESSRAFRAQLLEVSPENIHSVYIFSYMAMAINIALSRGIPDRDNNQSILGQITILFELFLGSSSIAVKHMDWLLDSPISPLIIHAGLLLMPAIMQPIDESTEAALARLTAVVNSGVSIPNDDQAAKEAASSRLELYQNAATNLCICFSVDVNSRMIGFCIAFPSLAGRDFTLGVKNSEPVALFILLHWAILLQRLGDRMWWAGSIGRRLVQEVADVLVESHPELAATSEWRDGIAWACNQVGFSNARHVIMREAQIS